MQPLMSKATLKVVINPFASPLDENGRPHTLVRFDPEHSGGAIRYIGAVIDRKPTAGDRGKPRDKFHPQRQRFDSVVRYDLSAQPIVHSAYHVQQVRDGALLPADEKTARLCGVLKEGDPFQSPVKVLQEAMTRAVEAWTAEHPDEELDPKAWTEGEPAQLANWPAWDPPLREAQPGEVLPEVPPEAYPPGATPLTPLEGMPTASPNDLSAYVGETGDLATGNAALRDLTMTPTQTTGLDEPATLTEAPVGAGSTT